MDQPAFDVSAKLRLIIRDRQSVIIDKEVAGLTAQNKTGVFDILKDHAQFVTLVSGVLVVHNLDGSTQEIPVDEGVIKVRGNFIKVFLGVKGRK